MWNEEGAEGLERMRAAREEMMNAYVEGACCEAGPIFVVGEVTVRIGTKILIK